MSTTKISEIKAIGNCNLIAVVSCTTGVKTYGGGTGKYVNLVLLDDDLTIKLTLFGDVLVKKVENVEVNNHFFFIQRNNEVLFACHDIKDYCFFSASFLFQVGKKYHFKNCRVSKVKDAFAHLCDHPQKLDSEQTI